MIIRDPWGRREQVRAFVELACITVFVLVALFAPESCSCTG